MRILAADIGGTHSRFGLFEADAAGSLRALAWGRVSSAGPDFPAVLDALAAAHPELTPDKADMVSLAVAGPVDASGRVQPANLPYAVEAGHVRRRAGTPDVPVLLINDFEAQALACLTPVMDEALPLNGEDAPGAGARSADPATGHGFLFPRPGLDAPCAVIGAGTGLGMALLIPGPVAPGGARVLPSEGGHAVFPFVDEEEAAFGRFVAARQGVSSARGDDVVTGPGLALLHEYLTGEVLSPAELAAAPGFAASDTCRLFARFYGRICRNVALIALARSGLVITGGLAARCPALIRHPAFRVEFLDAPGQFRALLAAVPLWHNADQRGGLWGAALAGIHRRLR